MADIRVSTQKLTFDDLVVGMFVFNDTRKHIMQVLDVGDKAARVIIRERAGNYRESLLQRTSFRRTVYYLMR